jgi:hypothetical protein
MPTQRPQKKRRVPHRTVLRLQDLDQAKSPVLNSLASADAQGGIGMRLASSSNGTARSPE